MKRLIIPLIVAMALGVGSGGAALAARNPAGQGQPGAECGEENASVMPPGFSTDGFAHAEQVYAGSEGSASDLNSHSDHAVSQYDIACYQLTSNQH